MVVSPEEEGGEFLNNSDNLGSVAVQITTILTFISRSLASSSSGAFGLYGASLVELILPTASPAYVSLPPTLFGWAVAR